MLILVSGEGATDMGYCTVPRKYCIGHEFYMGPMAWIVYQMVEDHSDYPSSPGMTLAGRKRKQETAYFFLNACAMAKLAQDLSEERGDEVIAVLFHDSDHTRSSKHREWQRKWDSMIDGFSCEGFSSGIPMIPNPKSESWLLCALKDLQPYQNCDRIEDESGNDDSPNSLKAQLEKVLGTSPNALMLSELVSTREINVKRIDMPSFNRFKERLQECLINIGI